MNRSCHAGSLVRRSLLGGLAIAAAGVGSLAVGHAASAAAITVTTTADELDDNGSCSLREAVVSANLDAAVDACTAGSGADTIVVPAGTYLLSIPGAGEADGQSGDLDIAGDVTIQASGAVLDAGGIDRALDIHAGAAVTITGLTIQGGYVVSDVGGGVYNAGTLDLVDSAVTANAGDLGDVGPSSGAGIGNDGTLTLLRTTVTANALGQIYPAGSGGGVFNRGTLAVQDSTISGNHAWEGGGGIGSTGTVSLVGSTVSGNGTGCFECASEGGGVYSSGDLTAENSTISDNTVSGGDYSPSASGGGVFSAGTTSLRNVTIAGNLVTSLCDTHCFSSATGGGVSVAGGTTTMGASIVADNSIRQDQSEPNGGGSATSPSACIGTVTSDGYNLVDTVADCDFAQASTDLVGVDPRLGPLQDNGGPTATRALALGSPAIDAGSPACPAVDQRGMARPQDGNGDANARCDIGAFELEGKPPQVIDVTVDVRPGSERNFVNPRSKGLLRVAIMSTADFDASAVDAASVELGTGAASTHARLRDTNRDGRPDLVLRFPISASGIHRGDQSVCLTGMTIGGVPIHGCDSIQTVPRRP